MSDLPLDEKIRRQHAELVEILAPQPNLDSFLEEEGLPLDTGILLKAARDVAVKLKLAIDRPSAKGVLCEDRDKTQAFFSIAKVAFPTLQFVMSEQQAWRNHGGLPYFEVGYWIEGLSYM